jgi:hypothetical protein
MAMMILNKAEDPKPSEILSAMYICIFCLLHPHNYTILRKLNIQRQNQKTTLIIGTDWDSDGARESMGADGLGHGVGVRMARRA